MAIHQRPEHFEIGARRAYCARTYQLTRMPALLPMPERSSLNVTSTLARTAVVCERLKNATLAETSSHTSSFDSWRKIRDFDGATGWIHRALIGPARTAWVAPWESAQMFALWSGPEPDASTLAIVEPKVLVSVNHCSGTWCNVTKQSFDGYIGNRACGAFT